MVGFSQSSTGREREAGFDDIDEASWPSFELTTYSLPVTAMIDKVIALLLATPRLDSPGHTIVDGLLKPRRSTQRTWK